MVGVDWRAASSKLPAPPRPYGISEEFVRCKGGVDLMLVMRVWGLELINVCDVMNQY